MAETTFHVDKNSSVEKSGDKKASADLLEDENYTEYLILLTKNIICIIPTVFVFHLLPSKIKFSIKYAILIGLTWNIYSGIKIFREVIKYFGFIFLDYMFSVIFKTKMVRALFLGAGVILFEYKLYEWFGIAEKYVR